jgi:SAM-dependent methyltransferase
MVAGVETWRRIQEAGIDPRDKVFFEVGTGRVPLVPLAYWLMGAARTITIDLNPYLKVELVRESLDYIHANQSEIKALFGTLMQQRRLQELLDFRSRESFSLEACLRLCSIEYIAPGDAARTGLPDRSVDFHTSYTVLEHIPPQVLERILEEGNRIVRSKGVFVHMIDYSDHFSHSDKTISSINFLQYSDKVWTRYAGNRYMYMNRLRHDDFLSLFQAAGHRILATAPTVDDRVSKLLEQGRCRLAERFSAKAPAVLSIRGSWILSQRTAERGDGRQDT